MNLGDDFLDLALKAEATKAKVNEWDCIKLGHFCAAEETLSKLKRRLTEWERIFANHTFGKSLISKIYKPTWFKNLSQSVPPSDSSMVQPFSLRHRFISSQKRVGKITGIKPLERFPSEI